MNRLLALLLVGLACSCATSPRPADPDVADPGRLPSSNWTTSVAGLRPCNDGAERALHLDRHQSVTILVYGRNGTTGGFQGLAEALAASGQQTVCFDYDGRASLMRASGQLAQAVDLLARDLETPKITVIGHSLGGLVARKALIRDRRDRLRDTHVDLQLVTISAPFSGVAMARNCANPVLRAATLGFLDFGCWLISGDNWFEITPASDFIRRPGKLKSEVRRHLMIVTDERGTCRRRTEAGRCAKDDYVLSLAEQQFPAANPPRTTRVEVAAGHSEVIGGPDVPPLGLVAVLQREGVVRQADLARHARAE